MHNGARNISFIEGFNSVLIHSIAWNEIFKLVNLVTNFENTFLHIKKPRMRHIEKPDFFPQKIVLQGGKEVDGI